MSLNHITSSANLNPWMNINAQDIKCQTLEVAGGTTFSGPFNITETKSSVINGNVSVGVPLLQCNGTSVTADMQQIGISCNNASNQAIKLVSQNAPTSVQGIWADNKLNLTTFSNPGTISVSPNQVTTISTNQNSTSISTPLSLPAQQYLELNLSAPQTITNATSTPINYNVTVKNIGDIGYSAGVVTINTAGTYMLSYYITYQSNADNNARNALISVGGVNYSVQNVQNGNGSTSLSCCAPVSINSATTLSFITSQSSGGSLNVTASRASLARIA